MERTRQKHPFGLPSIGIPAEVLFHPYLTNTEKMLFGFLQNLAQTEKGCWASNSWLGGLLGVKPQTITNGVSNLQKWGFIYVEFQNRNKICSRRIFINQYYPQIYREIVEKGHAIIDSGSVKELFTAIKNLIGGYKNFNRGAIKKFIGNIIIEDNSKIKKINKKNNNKSSTNERNKIYLPIAKYLSGIVQKTKNITHTSAQLKTWSNDIRQLVENQGVEIKRIKEALKWYKKNVGGQYIPVIESGNSLRHKFTKLEDAIKRDNSIPQTNGHSINPKKIIKQHFPEYYQNTFYKYFINAEDLIPDINNQTSAQLAYNMISLYEWVENNRESKETSPGAIIDDFTRWLNEQSWISDKTIDIYKPQSTIFKQFIRKEGILLKKIQYN